jgi:hypothetical protein
MKFNLRTCAIIGAAFTVTACESGPTYHYYMVESRFVSSAMDQQAPEIIPTPAYTQLAGGATTVAVRAPDRCSNSTTNQATGEAAAGGAILQTNCGVEMGEIERALTRAGYNVISWNILEREMERDKTASDVANRLGAQILFQINSLERSRKTLGQDARWERSYFTTDAAAAKTAPLPLTEQARSTLSTNYLAPIEAKQNPRAYAVTLDASAIWVPTGQSIWYYRWTRAAEPTGVTAGYKLRLQCVDGYGFGQCQSVGDPAGPAAPPSTVLAAGESVALSAGERPEDVERAIYLDLFKQVVRNFVDTFARARQFAPSQPVAAPAAAPAPVETPAPEAAPTGGW